MGFRSFPSVLVLLASFLLPRAAAQPAFHGGPYFDILSPGRSLTAADALALEKSLRTDPEDSVARWKLIAHYFLNPGREAWSRHVFWLIEHHPESLILAFNFTGIYPSASSRNTEADYARAKELWLEQTERHPKDPRVWANARRFFHSDAAAEERLLTRAGELGIPMPPPYEPTPIRTGFVSLAEKVDPVYPPLARRARIQGAVRLAVIIGRDGHVQNLQLISGHPLLVPAAREAVGKWVFHPSRLNGYPIETITEIYVPFTLPKHILIEG